ncbi:hypothetical protein SORBI_3004G135366 [Sorghum bicolor]|uniref:Uncharacterized protein n=1 Tax=Sorghum bicolor TaxID=4558 RepID=A0A1Z5RM88_SORBI|nr:hypothetical protein SORBI_3004G135366 [Sorghum bicolor]
MRHSWTHFQSYKKELKLKRLKGRSKGKNIGANKDGEQIAEVAATTNMVEGNVTTESEEISHHQDNLGSSLPLTQLAATAPAGTSTTCTTRSAANKSKIEFDRSAQVMGWSMSSQPLLQCYT